VTPSDVIVEARKLLQDTQAPNRYSDADMLGYVNQTLRRMAVLRPTLFTSITSVPLAANTVIQDLPPDGHRLVQMFFIDGYNSVNEVNREVFERAYPQWVSDPAGIPFNFVRHSRNATKFFVYPRPIAGLTATIEYVIEPKMYTINEQILYLKDTYLGVVVDGVVFLASSIDDEHVNSNRAKLFLDSFTQALGVDLQQQAVLDNERMPVTRGER
jgi:hypothetical protein